MPRLFKGDVYIEIDTADETIKLDGIDEVTQRRLDVDFDCLKTRSSHPNKSTVTIYNLNPTTRAKLETEGEVIRVFAGYDRNEKLIATGNIVIAESRRDIPDWATQIFFGDGQAPYENAVTSVSFSEGTNVKEVIKRLASDFGLAIKKIPEEINEVLNSGLTLDGLTKDSLNEVAQYFDFEWSIQDDEMAFTKEQEPVDDEVVQINSGTGLLEAPIRTTAGIKLRAQLNTDVRPDKIIEVTSDSWRVENGQAAVFIDDDKSYNGLYLCRNVTFTGNNYGGNFDVEIEAREYNAG